MASEAEGGALHDQQHRRPPRVHARSWRALAALLMIAAVTVPAIAQTAYSVGPQDVLAITVWGQPDLSGRFPVGADGVVVFPLAGRIAAGGRTALEIQDDLVTRLRDRYVRNPQVTVAVEQFRSQQVFVVGEVQRAGSYPLTGSMTLLEALAHAGSTSARAGAEALIVRQIEGSESSGPARPGDPGAGEVLRVALDQLARGDLNQNIALRAGDTVFIPRGETVFVLGEVRSPGEYAVRRTGTTVLQVLALAGGVTAQGSMRRVRIVRTDGSSTRRLKGNVNDTVIPGDTVIVAESLF